MLRFVDDVDAARKRREELLHAVMIVAVRDEERRQLVDLLRRFAGRQAR